MRLPFFSKAKRGQTAASGGLDRELAKKEAEAPATSKKASKAARKEQAKQAVWKREQERRRLQALERWEAVLHREAPTPATTQPVWRRPSAVTSAGGRLERSGSHSRPRSSRFLDIDNLDELEDGSEDERSDGDNDGPASRLAAGAFRMDSSQTAQLHQVACMRELPMLERCTRRQAPSSFFVDMLLLGDASDTAERPKRERRRRKVETAQEEVGARRRGGAEKRQQADERASRSCPTRPSAPSNLYP